MYSRLEHGCACRRDLDDGSSLGVLFGNIPRLATNHIIDHGRARGEPWLARRMKPNHRGMTLCVVAGPAEYSEPSRNGSGEALDPPLRDCHA